MQEQPHSEPYEKACLALCLQYPDTSGAVIRSSITSDAFYLAHNRQLFEAILAHHHDGEVAILDKAMRSKAYATNGGEAYFDSLRNTKISEKRREETIKKLSELLCCRRVIDSYSGIVDTAYSGEYGETNVKIGGLMDSLSSAIKHDDRGASIKDCLNNALTDMMEMHQSGKSICKPVGLHKLDCLTGGLMPEHIMISGPTSSGKSALMNQYIIANCRDHKKPGVIFSFEMDKKTVTKRLLASMSGVSLSKLMGISPDGTPIKFFKQELEAVRRAVGEMSEWKLFIEDDVTATIEDVWNRSVEIKAMVGDMGAVGIDYIQLMADSPLGKGANRERQVSHQGLKCKQLSKHLGCTVMGLSQMAQDFSVRESKALEQHAGILLRVMRGEDMRTGEKISDEHLYLWKNRNSERFVKIPIVFDGPRQKFTER